MTVFVGSFKGRLQMEQHSTILDDMKMKVTILRLKPFRRKNYYGCKSLRIFANL